MIQDSNLDNPQELTTMTKTFNPGDRVRLTGAFLRNTGQIAGGEGRSVWTVQVHPGCKMCASGDMILTNQERSTPEDFTPEEYAADPLLRYRHINAANLQRVRS